MSLCAFNLTGIWKRQEHDHDHDEDDHDHDEDEHGHADSEQMSSVSEETTLSLSLSYSHTHTHIQCNQAREQNFSKSLFLAKNCTDVSTYYQNGHYNHLYCILQKFIFPIYS